MDNSNEESEAHTELDKYYHHQIQQHHTLFRNAASRRIIVLASAVVASLSLEHTILPQWARWFCKTAVCTSKLRGQDWLDELRRGHKDRIHNALRMDIETFDRLTKLLVATGKLPSTRYMSHDEQLAIFLYTCSGNVSSRIVRERFQRSADTVSRSFKGVIRALVSLKKRYLKLPVVGVRSTTPTEIRRDRKLYPYFKDCIGAIDGSHISAAVLETQSIAWRNRKGTLSQNVLAVCGFDMRFQYILAGWEGSAHDSKVLSNALELGFSVPPGKYYLADAGYALSSQFLVPYRGVRYHLKEFAQGNLRPSGPKELFNLRHASARNVIERIFGALKKRSPMLSNMKPFPIEVQVDLVTALAILFNFIREEGRSDSFDDSVDDELSDSPDDDTGVADDRGAGAFRDKIAMQMWNDYVAFRALR